MRKLVIGSCIFLIISGLILHYWNAFESLTGFSVVSALHIWSGIFFIVIFPMYSWDHISTHKRRLKRVTGRTLSGGLQFFSGLGLILSGIVLLLYGTNKLNLSTEIHFVLTFFLAASLALHYFTKK